MPSKPVVKHEKMLEILQKFPLFDSERKLKKFSDPVWNDVAVTLPQLKKVTIYLQVLQDRKLIQTKLKDLARIEKSDVAVDETEESNALVNDRSLEIQNLLSMTYCSVKYASFIKKLMSCPLTVMYSSPEQLFLWNALAGTVSTTLIMIDGYFEEESSLSDPRLLYILIISHQNQLFPLFQCISENRSLSLIGTFLREFIRNNASAPSEIFCGFIPSLWDILTKVFNDCSIDEYNELLFSSLISSENLPKILIRSDRIEMLRIVSKWKCLTNQYKRKFLISCIILLSEIRVFEVFQEMVVNIFHLLLSRHDVDSVKMSRQCILSKIETPKIKSIYDNFLEKISDSNFDKVMPHLFLKEYKDLHRQENTMIRDFIIALKNKALIYDSECDEDYENINAYYCLDTAEQFKELLFDFPIWTRIISFSEDISPTQISLDYSLLLRNTCNSLNITQFLKSHWNLINEQCSAMRKHLKQDSKKTVMKSNYKYLNLEENWKGKNVIDKDTHSQKAIIEDSVESSFPVSEVINSSPLHFQKEIILSRNDSSQVTIPHNDDVDIEMEYKPIEEQNIISKEIVQSPAENLKFNSSEVILEGHNYSPCLVTDITDSKFQLIEEEIVSQNSIIESLQNYSLSFSEIKHSTLLQSQEKKIIGNRTDLEKDTNMQCESVPQEMSKIAKQIKWPAEKSKLGLVAVISREHNYSCCTNSAADVNDSQLQLEEDALDLNRNLNPQDVEPTDNVADFKAVVEKTYTAIKNDCGPLISTAKKKPSKYCDPFPAASVCYENALKKKKFPGVFRNSTLLNPRKLKNKIYIIRNSSAFDAVLEALVFGYKNFRMCQELCDNIVERNNHEKSILGKKNSIMKVIKDFAITEKYQNFYTSRFYILLDIAVIDNDDTIHCKDQIGQFIDKIMQNNYSFLESFSCVLCKNISLTTVTTIFMSNLIIKKQFIITDLNEYVKIYFEERRKEICVQCRNNITFNSREFGPYLFIDIEEVNIDAFINSVPIQLILDEKKFQLIGLISKKVKADPDDEIQYVAYCRTLFGKWYIYDNLKRNANMLRILPKLYISVILYAPIM